MKNWPFWFGLMVAAALAAYFFWPEQALSPQSVPGEESVTVPPPAVVSHPIEAVTTAVREPLLDPAVPLPTLTESDPPMADLLGRLFAEQHLARYFLLPHFVERCVVMVDNLPRQELPASHRPLRKFPGGFKVSSDAGALVIDPANYERYSPWLDLVEAIDAQQVVNAYVQLYPLFQEAYRGLGYPQAHFNDRLVTVIDHLLKAPRVRDPVALVQPKALYLYADPAMERWSAGHKIMVRIGPENANRVKALLRTYRGLLTGAPLSPSQ